MLMENLYPKVAVGQEWIRFYPRIDIVSQSIVVTGIKKVSDNTYAACRKICYLQFFTGRDLLRLHDSITMAIDSNFYPIFTKQNPDDGTSNIPGLPSMPGYWEFVGWPVKCDDCGEFCHQKC